MSIDYIITHLGILKMAIDTQIEKGDKEDALKKSSEALVEAQLLLASMKIREDKRRNGENKMSIVKELEKLKLMVMDRKTIDLTDRIYVRSLINEVIQEAKEAKRYKVPEFLQKEVG